MTCQSSIPKNLPTGERACTQNQSQFLTLQSLLCYSTPNTHPFISKKELAYLNKSVTTAEHKGAKDPVPWKALLRSAPVWALVCAAVSYDAR